MKNKIIFAIIAFLMTGCTIVDGSSIDNSSQNPSDSVSEVIHTGKRTLNFYGINDFHGAIIETSKEPGIFKLSTYMKDRFAENPNGSVFLNAGDYWQGSAESNINRGAFLTEAMNLMNLDAMTLGNHEFDWYDTIIEQNKALADYPFLGANIIDVETGEIASNIVSYDDTFKGSIIVEKNDVKVGIIGTIGARLESSILAPAVAPYSFEPVNNYIRAEAANLRALGAEVIALSTHDSLTAEMSQYTSVINDSIIDLIFSAHYHVEHHEIINGVPIMQTNAYGKQIMEVEGEYDFDTKSFSLKNTRFHEASNIKTAAEDPKMLELYADYETEINEIKNEVVGSLTSTIYENQLVKMANMVMYEYMEKNFDYPNLVAVHNGGGVRVDSISGGDVTYGDIYRAFPFDNEILIIKEMDGSDLLRFIRGDNKGYSGSTTIKANEKYTLVSIDYITKRDGAVTNNYEQIPTGEYVRELIAQEFRDQGTINPSSYN